jgi:uncharacterized protein YgbK (DUF1537 family)
MSTLPAITLPTGPLVAFYGDDFTGSTDTMEVLTFAGLPTVLFLDLPDAADLARFGHCRGIGVAGTARSRSPAWMRENLPKVFAALDALGAPVLHYKICSTFDSSPEIGSIGCALDVALAATARDWCAMVVGAPALRRYQAFGNLFASVDGVGHRLDRHPTMARHPTTPMAESDLRRHLALQTKEPVALVDLVALKHGGGQAALDAARAAGTRVALFDVIDAETLAEAGRLIWQGRGDGILAVASSGLEYALVAHWRDAGLLPEAAPVPECGKVERLLVVSGSCSPVTAGQISRAVADGFLSVRLDVAAAVDPARVGGEIARATDAATAALRDGRDAIVFSAEGPHDPAIAALRDAAVRTGRAVDELQRAVAAALGDVLARVVERADVTRVVVAGGDTSGEATGRLGIHALEAIMPLAPGGPLCRAHRRGRPALDIVLKGGQIGGADFFGRVKRGRRS